MEYDAIVIGGGAAGLMTALTAAGRGKRVRVIDHANKWGKKILMSGGGRCNFTNYFVEPDNFLSQNTHFCKSALSRYTAYDFIEWVESYEIPYIEKGQGQLFCRNKAKDIVAMLLDSCAKAGVEMTLETSISSIQAVTSGFVVNTNRGELAAKNLVVATGGLSIPTMGATPFGYEIAKQFGLAVVPVRAALVPFTLDPSLKQYFSALSGVSLPCAIGTGQQVFQDDLLFTHRGLSGPAVLQISSYWEPGAWVEVDWLPQQNLVENIKAQRESQPNQSLRKYLATLLPARFVEVFLSLLPNEIEKKRLAELRKEDYNACAEFFHHWRFKPAGTEGYRTAEVTLGGVDTNEISSKTMASRRHENLYFVGEVLDVTGHLGGFNFQWAWSSGYVAGIAIE